MWRVSLVAAGCCAALALAGSAAASTPSPGSLPSLVQLAASPGVATDASFDASCDYSTGEIIAIVLGFILGIIPGIILLILLC